MTIPPPTNRIVLRADSDFVLSRTEAQAGVEARLTLTLVAERDTSELRGRLFHELALLPHLDGAWAARPLTITGPHGREELALEDPGGMPLSLRSGAPLVLDAFLRVATSIAAALGSAHAAGILHRDIRPANILGDLATGKAHLIGFGLARRLTLGDADAAKESLAGAAAYMSPEQTGRVHLAVDERSDLYALGVTLYELVTGALPFSEQDPVELVYSHVARLPTPPAEVDPAVPGAVSAIIMKLLAKAPADRYQTARGVEHDLRRCLEERAATGEVVEFSLGMGMGPDSCAFRGDCTDVTLRSVCCSTSSAQWGGGKECS